MNGEFGCERVGEDGKAMLMRGEWTAEDGRGEKQSTGRKGWVKKGGEEKETHLVPQQHIRNPTPLDPDPL